jgi:1-deoxy-D-xylulose-5-phosphate synthase
VGFVARYLSHLRSRVKYVRIKQKITKVLNHTPLIGRLLTALLQGTKKKVKRSVYSGTSFFENMGFHYMGPVDGHNLDDLIEAFRAAKSVGKPVVLHVNTIKGKGSPYAEQKPDTYHGISQFDPDTGVPKSGGESFSSRFGQTLCDLAAQDSRIVAVTAAMVKGTCLEEFKEKYPTRFFDTGIAEEHAVTFSAGMARGGLLPVFAVYSTFLQRSYDQLINDTALMNNHVVLAIDRAGVVPDDGETHQGIYDVAMLATIPNVTMYAPSNFKELDLHLRKAIYDTTGIAAVRYPKGGEEAVLTDYEPVDQPYVLDEDGKELLLITYGRTYGEVLALCRRYRSEGKSVSLLKLGRILPVADEIVALAAQYKCVLVLEETRGGVGDLLGNRLMQVGYGGHYAVRAIEETLGACTTAQGLHRVGLDAEGISAFVKEHAYGR